MVHWECQKNVILNSYSCILQRQKKIAFETYIMKNNPSFLLPLMARFSFVIIQVRQIMYYRVTLPTNLWYSIYGVLKDCLLKHDMKVTLFWFKIFQQKSGRTWTCTINFILILHHLLNIFVQLANKRGLKKKQDSGNYVALTLSGMTFCPQIPNL
jgi:hypothetical protein